MFVKFGVVLFVLIVVQMLLLFGRVLMFDFLLLELMIAVDIIIVKVGFSG